MWPFKKNKEKIHPWPPVRSDAWPKYVDRSRPILCWTNFDDDERVFLIERADGHFTSEYQYFSDHEFEMCWIASGSTSIYDSAEAVMREIGVKFPWTKNIVPQKRAEH